MKKALIGVLVIGIAFCAIPLPSRQGGSFQSAARGSGPLRAGAAKVRIELPEHPVLAGYAGHHRAREWNEPVHARALVLEAGSARAVIAAIDTLLVPPGFPQPEGCALLAATHTHTGPGGLWDNALTGLLGAGAPDSAQRAAVVRALREAVDRAAAALAPAELQMGRELWPQGPSVARSEGPIDPELVALRLRRPSGPTVATVIVYAMHPTSAPHDVLSADWPAQLEAGPPTLVLQGAVGNTTWPRGRPLAPPIAAQVETLLHDAPWLSELPLDCETRSVATPPAQASLRVPWLVRRAATNLLTLAYPPDALQTRLRLGPVTLLGVPGEPVGELGLLARPAVVVGLAGGYLGYLETRERWERGEGEATKTYFGPDLAHALGLGTR